jgi:type III pantothenate kinase
MNLIVDVGNTFVKFAVFKEDTLVKKHSFKLNQFIPEFITICKEFKYLQNCIISSVGKLDNESVKLIKTKCFVVFLDSSTKVPFENLYKTPMTLGVDRIALVSASASQYSNKNVLIIDAGTCITYDFINSENQYLGGAISPGIQMRYQSLNNFTANLPLLDTKLPENIIGNTTNEAIHSGVVLGILNEIKGAITIYKEKYTDLTVILTGGDAIFLSKQLKSSIFANSNFLLEGLNYILQFNLNE